ncbi:UBX domain-containing protein 8 [Electrophorus electricus]|uniref:UBX domain-containing protein n=1 Tax=Electrophorus electricus TaxID=8005 RepID=A0AAY5EIK0_ELEEL|nr:UBX domain-containing protein 8 [Electrophorus electricus]
MAAAREYLFVGVLGVSVFCIVSWKYSILGVKDAVKLAGRGMLFLGLSVFMTTFLYPKLKRFLFPGSTPALVSPAEESHVGFKQEQARREQQHQHIVKSNTYHEAVLKPRQEVVRRKKEENFYRMTGQTWKLSPGVPLGGEEEIGSVTEDGDNETPSLQAAKKRKVLDMPLAPVLKDLPKEKRIIILPEEPSEDAEGVVKIALRCPSGRILRRRFFKTCCSLVLLDWLYKSGYSPIIYALYTSYPRRLLLTQRDLSMEDVGIITDTILNVGEKDPPTV